MSGVGNTILIPVYPWNNLGDHGQGEYIVGVSEEANSGDKDDPFLKGSIFYCIVYKMLLVL